MAKSYFINNIDSYIGQQFLTQLKGTEEEPSDNTIIGTKIDAKDWEKPQGMKKILKRHKPLLFRKYLSEMDVLIYDTLFGDITEVRKAIETFKKPGKEIESQKVIIQLSSIRSWSNNGKKEKVEVEEVKEGEGEGGEGEEGEDGEPKDPDDEDGNELQNSEEPKAEEPVVQYDENGNPIEEPVEYDADGNIIPKPPKEEPEEEYVEPVYEAWTDKDYLERMPLEQYEQIKQLEDEVLEMGVENVKTFVICSGLIYGNGENAFYELVKSSWIQDPRELPYYGDGTNLVPTIHVKDLVKFCLKIAETTPENNPYHFAFDNSDDRTLRSIIKSLSKKIGSGGTLSIEGETELIPKDYEDMFKANQWAETSALLRTEEPADGEEAAPPEFEWHAEKGIAGCADKILKEFTEKHNLKPIKIVLSGHSDSGKSHFSKQLSDHYKIPVLSIEKIFEHFPPELVQGEESHEDELDDELITDYSELKEGIDELLEQVCKDGLRNLEINEFSKCFYRILKWRLSQNDCQNRGYVFDNPVIGFKDFMTLFIDQKKKLKRIKPKKKKTAKRRKQLVVEEAEPELDADGNPIPKAEANGDDPDADGEGADPKDEAEEPNPNADANPEGDAAEPELDDDGNPIINPEEAEEESEYNSEDWEEYTVVTEPELDDEGNVVEKVEEDLEAVEEEEEGATGPKTELFLPETFVFLENFKNPSSLEPEQPDSVKVLNDFCEELDIETFNSNIRKNTDHEGLESLRIFIERNGRPFNYLTDMDFLKEDHDQFYDKFEEKRRLDITKKGFIQKEKVKKAKNERLQRALKQVQIIRDNELGDKGIDKAVRKYLTDCLEPVLTEGLLHLTNVIPNDPVDYLAEYIHWRSFEF